MYKLDFDGRYWRYWHDNVGWATWVPARGIWYLIARWKLRTRR